MGFLWKGIKNGLPINPILCLHDTATWAYGINRVGGAVGVGLIFLGQGSSWAKVECAAL